jgi:predicted PurR-regulated permease PerM
VIKTVERDFGQWVRGQLLLGLAVGVATFIGLIILSRFFPVFGQYAVLLSVIAGLFELVPIIGPIISAVPAVLLGATESPAAIVAAIGLYFIVQQTENNFLCRRSRATRSSCIRPWWSSRSSSAGRSRDCSARSSPSR